MAIVNQPIGSICAWLKSIPNVPSLPSDWVECNGQTINDSASPLNGKTVPNLNNGTYLRGGSSSGGTGGGAHSHSTVGKTSGSSSPSFSTSTEYMVSSTPYFMHNSTHKHYIDVSTSSVYVQPPNYTVVWIMRIK